MPPTTPAIRIFTGTREDAAVPSFNTPALVKQAQGPRKRKAAAFLIRLRARRVARISSYYDPLFGRPDLVEDDYHRFRIHPSG